MSGQQITLRSGVVKLVDLTSWHLLDLAIQLQAYQENASCREVYDYYQRKLDSIDEVLAERGELSA